MLKNKYLLLLFSFFIILSIVNFPWGKWFLGWDNLVPEFNFGANIQRAIFSLWQENEGLGLIGGHGYTATLLHSLALLIGSIAIPINYLRPIFTLGMLLIGSLGSFFLTKILLETKEEKIRNKISFIAGLFYMLNFATVQMFYIPLEAFCIHYASLPWLLYSLIMIFKNPNKQNFFIFAGISFLSSPQGFIPPLFFIYALFLIVFCVVMLIKRRTIDTVKLAGLVLTVTVFVNAYWLLPVGFYTFARSSIYLNSYNNLVTTEDFTYKSRKYGNINSLVSLKGLIYDAVDSKETENIFYIFQSWKNHLDNNLAVGLSYFLFLVILLGVYDSWKKGNVNKKIFIILFLFSFTFLATDVFPFSYASNILRNTIPIIKQVVRIGFTKFSVSLALFYSIFLAFGLFALINKIDKLNKRNLSAIIYIVIAMLIFYLSFPSFKGYFFYNRIKVKFPEDYNHVFEFFKSQDGNTRIADFPQATPIGWSIYNWDYTGSGFWWYGLNQPIMDRNFDVWSNFNENYYWELSQAIYSGDTDSLSRIFKKYQVKWLLIDRNLVSFVSQKAIYIDKLEQMLSDLPQINLMNTFGKIKIYQVILDPNPKNFIFLADNLPRIGPGYKWNNYDKAYEEYGNYISLPENGKKSLSFGSFTQSGIGNNSNSQSQDSQSKIEKAKIVNVEIHNFTFNNNKLMAQKAKAITNPHTSITGLNLSSANGITMEASAIWPISAQISDNRLSWDLVNSSFTVNDDNTKEKSLSNNFVFLAKDLPVVNSYKWGNYDKAYEEYGNYITETQSSNVKTQNQSLKLKSDNLNNNLSTKKSASQRTLVRLANSFNDWTLNLASKISQLDKLVKSQHRGVDLPGIAPGRLGLRVQSSELARPTPELAYQEERTLVNSVFAADISDPSTVRGVRANTSEVSLPDIYYPFRSLFTGRKQEELEFGVEAKEDYFSFRTKIPKSLVGYKLVIPTLEDKEVSELDENDLSKKSVKAPQIYLDGEIVDTSSFWGAAATPESDSGQARMTGGSIDLSYIKEGNLEVQVPKIKGYYSSDLTPVLMSLEAKTCDQFNKGIYTHEQIRVRPLAPLRPDPGLLRLTSIGSSNCLDFDLPNLSQDIGYLVTLKNRYIEGKSLLFSVINKNSQRADIETYLPKRVRPSGTSRSDPDVDISYFIIPPMEQYGLGYTLHLDNISIGRVKTVNDLGRITVNPIPYRFLTGMKILKGDPLLSQGVPLQNVQVDHPNPSLYVINLDSSTIGGVRAYTPEVSLPQANNTTLVLSQSFDSGWRAYSISSQPFDSAQGRQLSIINYLFPFWTGQELKDHVLVNNWENGWLLSDNTQTIIIVYLPQYLEYIGFILLGVAFLIVIFYPNSPILNPSDGKS